MLFNVRLSGKTLSFTQAIKLFLLLLIITSFETLATKESLLIENTIKFGSISVKQGALFYKIFGSGETIIMLHGGLGLLDHNYLLPHMLNISNTHQIIFYDQRGCGKSSTHINSNLINLQQITNDLEQLRMTLGIKKFILMGHSWGALVALNYAVMYKDQISKLILYNIAPINYKDQLIFIINYIKKSLPQSQMLNIFQLYQDKKTHNNLSYTNILAINKIYQDIMSLFFYDQKNIIYLNLNIHHHNSVSNNKILHQLLKTYLLHDFNSLLLDLKSLFIPTLIIHGTEDLISHNTAKKIHSSLKNSNLIYLKNCGHFPYIEQPTRFFSITKLFIGF